MNVLGFGQVKTAVGEDSTRMVQGSIRFPAAHRFSYGSIHLFFVNYREEEEGVKYADRFLREYLKNCNRFTLPELNLGRFTANFPRIKIRGTVSLYADQLS